MPINNHESRHTEGSGVTLAWAVDDRDAPTELTIFDPDDDVTTRWITMDEAHVCDLNETA